MLFVVFASVIHTETRQRCAVRDIGAAPAYCAESLRITPLPSSDASDENSVRLDRDFSPATTQADGVGIYCAV
jgi:hypothetical protein